jgi:hypothetical protein
VNNVSKASKATMGHNPFQAGQPGAVPFLSTHDGRTIRYPDPLIKKNDTVQIDIKTGKITAFLKFDVGNLAMVTKGANIGRVGVIVSKEKHPVRWTARPDPTPTDVECDDGSADTDALSEPY